MVLTYATKYVARLKPSRSKRDVWDTLNYCTIGLKNTHFDFCYQAPIATVLFTCAGRSKKSKTTVLGTGGFTPERRKILSNASMTDHCEGSKGSDPPIPADLPRGLTGVGADGGGARQKG